MNPGIHLALESSSSAERFPVLLLDPPWSYAVWSGEREAKRTAASHYPTMELEAIADLPIASLATENAALFLWVTPPLLDQAFPLVSHWGFAYKTIAFTWVKTTKTGEPAIGLGHYTRGNVELCLLAIRGRMKRQAADVRQVIQAPRREHSRKPDEQYGRIMRLFTGPYCEVFARQQWPGWSVVGNQTSLFASQPFLFEEREEEKPEQPTRLPTLTTQGGGRPRLGRRGERRSKSGRG